SSSLFLYFSSFFFTDPATSAIYTLSLHDALPIFAIAGSKAIVIAFSRCYDRVHDGQHIGVRERFAGRGIVDVCRLLCHGITVIRSEEHTSELQSLAYLVCRLLLEKKKKKHNTKSQ